MVNKIYIVIITLIFIFCTNPQLSEEIRLNYDSRFVGKWIQLNSKKSYHFRSDGTFDHVDSNYHVSVYGNFSDQYATYFNKYINMTFHVSQISNIRNQEIDTIILLDLYRKYLFFGDTLIFERKCFLFNGTSTSLVGNWTHIPLRHYLVDNTYIYNEPGTKYMKFGNDGFLHSDFDWYSDSFPSPYPYIDQSTYFELYRSNNDSNYINFDYLIYDSLLVLLMPPYDSDSIANFSSDTLIREK